MRRLERIEAVPRLRTERFLMRLQSSNPNPLVGQLVQRLPCAVHLLGAVGGGSLFITRLGTASGILGYPTIDDNNLAAASVSCATSESLHQAGPGSQLRDEAASGEIDPGFDHLSGNDDPIRPLPASGTGQEALAPPFALGWPETA